MDNLSHSCLFYIWHSLQDKIKIMSGQNGNLIYFVQNFQFESNNYDKNISKITLTLIYPY